MNISIENYSVDNIKWFKEHEGLDAFQCDILFNNKKIGFFSESYMNGPDEMNFNNDFDLELKNIRETANKFFKMYSKDEFLNNVQLNTKEDFFIRFLKSLKEASKKAKINQEISISTSYPFDYKLVKNDYGIKPRIDCELRENKLVIPFIPQTINLDFINEEYGYGIS